MTTTAKLRTVTLYRSGDERFEVPYRFAKRSYGGWLVLHGDTGRRLGWICPQRKRYDGPITGWSVHVNSGAFCGSGPEDTGDILDYVPADLTGYGSDGTSPAICYGVTREDAAWALLQHLDNKNAPALGHGPHYRVIRYADRNR